MAKVKLKVGMRMKCAMYGECTITKVGTMLDTFPVILVSDIEDLEVQYTYKGQYNIGLKPTLKLLNIPFTDDMEVECDIYGSGVVTHINTDPVKPIGVLFDNGDVAYYLTDGRISPSANQTLFPKFTI